MIVVALVFTIINTVYKKIVLYLRMITSMLCFAHLGLL